jgi:hypothetical protein
VLPPFDSREEILCRCSGRGDTVIMDLIEEQPSVVVEALLDYSKEKNRTERDEPRREMRKHYIGWFEAVLEEAKRRERRLLHGITGISPNNEEPN